MKRQILAIPALILVLSCTSGGPPPAEETEAPAVTASIPDSEVGLAPGTAFEQPPQAPIAFNRIDPGESELQPRPNTEFPPVIPHSIDDLETITTEENSCLECHGTSVAADMGAVAVPGSHLVDLRRSPEETGESVSGARWVCTSCHVAQTETDPLVAISSSR
jgi:cytochrome c-type protein NapB